MGVRSGISRRGNIAPVSGITSDRPPPRRQNPALVAGAVLSLLAAAAIAVPLGFLLLWGIDPGFRPVPSAIVVALILAALCYGLVSLARKWFFGPSWWIASIPVGVAVVAAIVTYEDAGGPSRDRSSRSERAMLSAIRPFPGSRAGSVRTDAESSSDWGISVVNPPESYTTSRTDQLPPHVSARRAANFYAAELRAHGFRVYRFLLHIPVEGTVHLGGHRGSTFLEIDVSPLGEAALSTTS
jgi:hypothetical protein